DRYADEKGHLRDPDRHLDQALRDLLELPALVDEAADGPEHVADECRGDAEREELHDPAAAGSEALEPQADTHQLAMAEGVAERQEGSGGAQPGDDIVGAAHQ